MCTSILNTPSLSTLLEDLYKRANVDWIASEYKDAQSYYHYDKEKLVGYCMVLDNDTICNLVVDKEYRKMGIASKLLRQVISKGAKYLASLKSNVKFYVNRGFKVYQVEYHESFKENIYYMSY